MIGPIAGVSWQAIAGGIAVLGTILGIILKGVKILDTVQGLFNRSEGDDEDNPSSTGEQEDTSPQGGPENTGSQVEVAGDNYGEIKTGDTNQEVNTNTGNGNGGDESTDPPNSEESSESDAKPEMDFAAKNMPYDASQSPFTAGKENTTIKVRIQYSSPGERSDICIRTDERINVILRNHSIKDLRKDGNCISPSDYRRKIDFQIRFEYDEDLTIDHFVRFYHEKTNESKKITILEHS